jgi:hypothetical protein
MTKKKQNAIEIFEIPQNTKIWVFLRKVALLEYIFGLSVVMSFVIFFSLSPYYVKAGPNDI